MLERLVGTASVFVAVTVYEEEDRDGEELRVGLDDEKPDNKSDDELDIEPEDEISDVDRIGEGGT